MAGMTPKIPQNKPETVNGMKSSGPVISPAQIWHANVAMRLPNMTEVRRISAANGATRNGPATQPAKAAATEFKRSAWVLW